MIEVAFNGDEERVKSNQHVYQWDTGQKVMVSGLGNSAINKVHFSFKGLITAYVVDTTNTSGTITVDVPDIVLRYGKDIYMYLCIENTTGILTIKTVIIPVVKRNMPENYIFNDEETVETSFDRLQDHETRIESLEDARTNINGSTFETLKGRIDYEVTALNNRITDAIGSLISHDSGWINFNEFLGEFTASKQFILARRIGNIVCLKGEIRFSSFTNPKNIELNISGFPDAEKPLYGDLTSPVCITNGDAILYMTAKLCIQAQVVKVDEVNKTRYTLVLSLPEGYTLEYLVGKTMVFTQVYVAYD